MTSFLTALATVLITALLSPMSFSDTPSRNSLPQPSDTPTPAAQPLPSPANSLQPIDQIAVIVNDAIITRSQVNQALDQFQKQLQAEHHADIPTSVLRKQVIDHLIDEQLQLQLAKKSAMAVTKAQVDDAITHIASQHHMTREALLTQVQQIGMSTAAYRQNIHNQLLIMQVQQQAVSQKIQITPAEISHWLDAHQNTPQYQSQYHVLDVLIMLNTHADAKAIAAAHQQATSISAKLKAGAQPKDILNATVSDLGWHYPNTLPDLFVPTIKKMAVKAVTNPIRADNGFHVLQLIDKKPPQQTLPSRAAVQQLLYQQQMQQQVARWLTQLRQNAYVKVVDAH